MNRTKIEWCDYTWNPVTGCKNGCIYCYAREIYKRFGWSFEPQFHEERLNEPTKLQIPAKIFMGSVTDQYAPEIPIEWTKRCLAVAKANPRHLFFALTKFPENLAKFQFPHNVWVGISIDRQSRVNGLKYLKQITAVRFVSFEPLLENVDVDLYGIDWIIIGGQTGRYRFTPPKKWVNSLIKKARRWGIAVFLKDNLGYPEVIQEWPEGPPCYHDEHDQPCSDYCPDTYKTCTIRDPDNCEKAQEIEKEWEDPNEPSEPGEQTLLAWC